MDTITETSGNSTRSNLNVLCGEVLNYRMSLQSFLSFGIWNKRVFLWLNCYILGFCKSYRGLRSTLKCRGIRPSFGTYQDNFLYSVHQGKLTTVGERIRSYRVLSLLFGLSTEDGTLLLSFHFTCTLYDRKIPHFFIPQPTLNPTGLTTKVRTDWVSRSTWSYGTYGPQMSLVFSWIIEKRRGSWDGHGVCPRSPSFFDIWLFLWLFEEINP